MPPTRREGAVSAGQQLTKATAARPSGYFLTPGVAARASLRAFAAWRATGDDDHLCDAVFYARMSRGYPLVQAARAS